MEEFTPVVKDGCGVFGVLRKEGAERIGNSVALKAIECVKYRGSNLGAGFASFTNLEPRPPARIKVFVDGEESLQEVRRFLSEYSKRGLRMLSESLPDSTTKGVFTVYEVLVDSPDELLFEATTTLNVLMSKEGIRARVYSSGRYVNVYKDVGYPRDVAKKCNLVEDRVFADAWLAHTRQPTNSPGRYPIWSHPFSSSEFAIVHNGDISSYGANMEFLKSVGITKHVGTDSEVVAQLLDHLVRVRRLSVREVATLLSNPYERHLDGAIHGARIRELIIQLRGAQLDGPFTIVAGYCDGQDTYLLGLTDRSKFRPIVVGEDDGRYFVASEEGQIRTLSPEARVWTIEPGRFFLASLKRGIIETGRRDRELFVGYSARRDLDRSPQDRPFGHDVIDAKGLSYAALNESVLQAMVDGRREVKVTNIQGQRYIGVNLQKPEFLGARIILYGYPGNCLANFNSGLQFIVHGNAADDVGDSMHAGRVIVHGDARDVIGQALQGGDIFVRGSVGNRAGIQMREYREKKPCMIVGGRADDYLGEYMAGGIIAILGLNRKRNHDGSLAGRFAGTGMVGGKVFIRSMVRDDEVGLPPPREDVLNYLYSLHLDGMLGAEEYRSVIGQGTLDYFSLKRRLPSAAFSKIERIFSGKYVKPPSSDYRELDSDEFRLLESRLTEYFETFGLTKSLFEEVVSSKFTVIAPYESTRPEIHRAESQVVEE
jgi:glutamate synthase domain-containing protein 1/formylmethanofuran dehydrogenase subunit C